MYKHNIIASIILLLLDFIWIKIYMGNKYEMLIKNIQKEEMQIKLQYGIIAYILMLIGLNMYVLPNIRKGYELEDSLKYGFTFGIVMYGIYNFTAASIIKNWDINILIKDIIWGGFVYFISSYISIKYFNEINLLD